jgi:hypothetical protein
MVIYFLQGENGVTVVIETQVLPSLSFLVVVVKTHEEELCI